jgi:soluble P-type ATPase
MLEFDIPGRPTITDVVLDFNGTLARDGELQVGVGARIQALAKVTAVHVVTADTFGHVREAVAGLPCKLHILKPDRQAEAKLAYVDTLGRGQVACVGNGANDRLMMEAAALAIGVVQSEGASPRTLMAADVIAPTACDALDLLLHPLRLKATLRE